MKSAHYEYRTSSADQLPVLRYLACRGGGMMSQLCHRQARAKERASSDRWRFLLLRVGVEEEEIPWQAQQRIGSAEDIVCSDQTLYAPNRGIHRLPPRRSQKRHVLCIWDHGMKKDQARRHPSSCDQSEALDRRCHTAIGSNKLGSSRGPTRSFSQYYSNTAFGKSDSPSTFCWTGY